VPEIAVLQASPDFALLFLDKLKSSSEQLEIASRGINVNREDAVEVMRKIMISCGSFDTAHAVVIQDRKTKSWVLDATWIPQPEEDDALKKILCTYSLEAIKAEGRTLIRSRQA
jgi:hypothetical protein